MTDTAQAPPQPHAVLDHFARTRGVRDTQVAALLDIHRNSVKSKRAGSIRLHDFEIDLLAQAFDVPAEVFQMSAIDAMRWAIDHRPAWFAVEDPDTPTSLTNERARRLEAKLRAEPGELQWNYHGISGIAA